MIQRGNNIKIVVFVLLGLSLPWQPHFKVTLSNFPFDSMSTMSSFIEKQRILVMMVSMMEGTS